MELTGSLYQDYTLLRNTYDKKRPILTGNTDVDYKILMYLEPDELSKVCRTNHYSRELCDNKVFWIDKFEHDKLPLLYKPDELNDWLILYKNTKVGYQLAKYALILQKLLRNDIEIVANEQLYVGSLIKQVNKNFKLQKVSQIYIDLDYNVELYRNDHVISKFKLDKDKIMILLTYCYMSNSEEETTHILANGVRLLIDDNFYQNHINDPFANEYARRNGMLNTIMYYEK